MNIVFHPKYRRFQLEIISNEDNIKFSKSASKSKMNVEGLQHDYFSTSNKFDLEALLKSKKRFEHVLTYAMNVRTTSDVGEMQSLITNKSTVTLNTSVEDNNK